MVKGGHDWLVRFVYFEKKSKTDLEVSADGSNIAQALVSVNGPSIRLATSLPGP